MNKLIILTKKWGRNFTGATLATQELVKQWGKTFGLIEVFTLECGEYVKQESLIVHKYESIGRLRYGLKQEWMKSTNIDTIICYSDDHLGYLYSTLKIPYYHTYHGNWPDAKYINIEFFLKSFYFIPLYKKTLANAKMVINVSKYMENFTTKINSKSIVIHNGIEKKIYAGQRYVKTCIMVGNIDKRKYEHAVELAKLLLRLAPDIKIHVYGAIVDKAIGNRLSKLSNVLLMGQCKDIPYAAYDLLINTSTIENLSISVCEAIKSNIPVFCFDVGGLPEVVKNGKTGYIFYKSDINSMANKIIDYINSENRLLIDENVLHDFDWSYASDLYLRVFNL